MCNFLSADRVLNNDIEKYTNIIPLLPAVSNVRPIPNPSVSCTPHAFSRKVIITKVAASSAASLPRLYLHVAADANPHCPSLMYISYYIRAPYIYYIYNEVQFIYVFLLVQECMVMHLRVQAKISTAALRAKRGLLQIRSRIGGQRAQGPSTTQGQQTAVPCLCHVPDSRLPLVSGMLQFGCQEDSGNAAAQHKEVHISTKD